MGDRTSCRLPFLLAGQFSIPPGKANLGNTITSLVFNWNNLAGFLGPLATIFPGTTNPPGFNTYLNAFMNYRVNACKLTLTVYSEGNAPEGAALQAVPFTPYVAIAAEPASTLSTPSWDFAPYWSYQSVRNARWSSVKTLTAPGSTGAKRTVSLYVTNKALEPDYVERDVSFQGLITPSTSGTPLAVFSAPTTSNMIGFTIGNASGAVNLAGISTYFTVTGKIVLYVSAWGRTPSSAIP